MDRFPDPRLYGPYHHGGRSYYQWMARGTGACTGGRAAGGDRAARRGRWHAADGSTPMRARYAGSSRANAAQVPRGRRWRDRPKARFVARFGFGRSFWPRDTTPSSPAGFCSDLLVDDPLAPTAVRDAAKVSDDHFADSLVAFELPELREGATSPTLVRARVSGLPLAIALPEAPLRSSRARPEVRVPRARRTWNPERRVVHGRAETWREGSAGFDSLLLGRLRGSRRREYAAPLLVLAACWWPGEAGANQRPSRCRAGCGGTRPAIRRQSASPAISRRRGTATCT